MAFITAHRGVYDRGFRPQVRENTPASIERAIAHGADMVEIDVRRTLDGELVLSHDEYIHGVPIGRLTYAALHHRARHQRVPWPRLGDVVQQCAGRIKLDVELKEPGIEREVGTVLLETLAPSELVTSFRDDVIAAMKRAHPEIRAGLLLGSSRATARAQFSELFPFGRVERCRADFIVPHASIADFLVRRAHDRGIGVMVWTMRRENHLARLILDPRVEAVITDRVADARRLRGDGVGVAIGA
ncbi:MAG: glycerophosphodiester phosphodiesterase [Candidatus Dormibacteria bacterium]